MRKVAIVLLVLIVVGIGTAFYLEWLSVSCSHESEAGRTAIQFVIDQNKAQADLQQLKEKVSGAVSHTEEKSKDQ